MNPTESYRPSRAGQNHMFAAWRGMTTMPCWGRPAKLVGEWAVAALARGRAGTGDGCAGYVPTSSALSVSSKVSAQFKA
jgi:hypothetical protein